MPTQSRSSLALLKKQQGIDVVEEFRRLAPNAEPISIQRWTPRRVRLTVGAAILVIFIAITVFQQIRGGGFL